MRNEDQNFKFHQNFKPRLTFLVIQAKSDFSRKQRPYDVCYSSHLFGERLPEKFEKHLRRSDDVCNMLVSILFRCSSMWDFFTQKIVKVLTNVCIMTSDFCILFFYKMEVWQDDFKDHPLFSYSTFYND